MGKILFTADLHLNIEARNQRTGRTSLDSFAEIVEDENPVTVVVAGDISTSERAETHIAPLQKIVGGRPLAITVGNHDFWFKYGHPDLINNLDQKVDEELVIPCRERGFTLLDRENASFEDIALLVLEKITAYRPFLTVRQDRSTNDRSAWDFSTSTGSLVEKVIRGPVVKLKGQNPKWAELIFPFVVPQILGFADGI